MHYFVKKNKVKVWLVFALAVLLLAPGVTRFQLDLSDEAFLSGDDQVRVDYDDFRAQFGGEESMIQSASLKYSISDDASIELNGTFFSVGDEFT